MYKKILSEGVILGKKRVKKGKIWGKVGTLFVYLLICEFVELMLRGRFDELMSRGEAAHDGTKISSVER